MLNNTDELKAKLLAAQSAEEVMEIVRAAGDEITAEEAKQFFENLQERKTDKTLSPDELEAVSGGRDWVTEGCAATVEAGSNCWGTDGGCIVVHYTYFREPTTRDRCPMCGDRVYYEGKYGVSTGFLQGYTWKEFLCRKCGPYKVKDDGTVF